MVERIEMVGFSVRGEVEGLRRRVRRAESDVWATRG